MSRDFFSLGSWPDHPRTKRVAEMMVCNKRQSCVKPGLVGVGNGNLEGLSPAEDCAEGFFLMRGP
jgi:hypothetical protein